MKYFYWCLEEFYAEIEGRTEIDSCASHTSYLILLGIKNRFTDINMRYSCEDILKQLYTLNNVPRGTI